MRGASLAVLAFVCFSAWAAAPGPALGDPKSVEVISLRSIAGWLKKHGTDGYMGADVADALGIPRAEDQEALEAKQRGFRNDKVLRIAQVLADEKRDYMLFMVQGPDDEVYFYLSTVREGLRKAFVSIPSRNALLPLVGAEAESNFRNEVLYWEDKAVTR